MIKVLYIEDEVSLGKITSDMLRKNGFEVEWVTNGITGLEHFQTRNYDICVVDIMLPGVDGYTLVKQIRETDKATPVIFLTARSLTEDLVKGFTIGGNDYLKKPFSIEELIVRMHALVNRHNVVPKELAEVFKLGSYTFNYKLMELCHAGNKNVLTHLENELLYKLVLNCNGVVEREKVLTELWGSDTFFNARSMDVFISKLRKYLSKEPNISIINIRRIGYKLVIRES